MTIKAAVLGDPIEHSLSPTIHNFFLEKYRIDGSYEAIRVEKNNFAKDVARLVQSGFVGFNVTLPHKEAAFEICQRKSKSAQKSGAVNTIVVMENGELFGHNSDADGFLRNLFEQFPYFNLQGKNVAVIGAGGAARAAIHGLITAGASEIFVTNRDENRAQNLIKNFAQEKNCCLKFLNKNDFAKSLQSCDLLVNTTSLGMQNQPSLELDLSYLNLSAIVYDIVYKPLMTELLVSAEKKGNKIVTGIGMLVHQALVGFELWFKTRPEIDDTLTKILIKKLES